MIRRSIPGRMAVVGVAVVGMLASVLLARPGVVRTKDGRTIEGDIVESVDHPDQITIGVHGAQLSINRTNIASLDYVGSFEDEYKKRLAKLGPNATAADHLTLARWLYDQKAYEQARTEVASAKKINPQDASADLLLTTINRQQVLDRTQASGTTGTGTTGTGTTTTGTGTATGTGATVTAPRPGARHLLSPEQIQIIKQGEMKQEDTGLRMTLANNVVRRYTDFDTKVTPAEFAQYSDFDKAIAILTRGTPEMRQDVKLLNDPSAIAAFKTIQPTILSGCAISGCHNEQTKTKFLLFTGNDTETTYTNFFILTQYATTINKVQHKMIDRTRPNESLVLQFGLARSC